MIRRHEKCTVALALLALCCLCCANVVNIGTESDDPEAGEAVEGLEKWADAQGMPVRKAEVHYYGSGMRYGVRARESLKSGEVYYAVPYRLLLSRETALRDPELGPVIKELDKRHGADEPYTIAFLLLRERAKGKSSFYYPYIRLLPRAVATPLFFAHKELSQLRGTVLFGAFCEDDVMQERAMLPRQQEFMERHIFSTYRSVFPSDVFTPANLSWAKAIFDSRVIYFPKDGERRGHLIPVIDMINCIESSDKTFTQYDPDLEAAVIRADRDTAAGEQIFETYGNKSNYEYLRYNGFVMRDNPNDCVYLALTPDDFNTREKQPLLVPIAGQEFRGCVGASNPKSYSWTKLLAFARGYSLKSSVFKSPRAKDAIEHVTDAAYKPESLSELKLELRAIRALRRAVKRARAKIRGSDKSDAAKLEKLAELDATPGAERTPEFNENMRNVYLFRLEERKYLSRLLQTLTRKIAELSAAVDARKHDL